MHELIARKVQRYQQFYASQRPGDLLIGVRQNPYWIQKKNLFDYDFTAGGHLLMAEDMARSAQAILDYSAPVDDDLIPWLCPDFGIAIHHTAFVDGPVQFAEWTSWADHPLKGDDGWAKLELVRYDPANRWVRLIKEMLAAMQARAVQPYLVNGHYYFSPFDLANALRGNALFTDIYDEPERCAELLQRCTDVIAAFETDLRASLAPRPGLPFWGALAPAGSVFISEDAMDLCGPKVSAEWGAPYSAQLRDRLGGLCIHHHMLGTHVHGIVGQLAQHSLVQISNDPNCPPAADKLLELYAASGTNALMFDCSLADLRRLREVLPQIRAVIMVAVGDNQADAREAVALVRGLSNIKS